MINRTLNIKEELELQTIFLECDQAIYTKFLDAMFKREHEKCPIFDKIIPQMGGFHVDMCILRTIFSLIKDSGLIQLLSSAGIAGEGTITKSLKGGDVDYGIELHKLLFEAFTRTKLNYLSEKHDQNITEENQDSFIAMLNSLREV